MVFSEAQKNSAKQANCPRPNDDRQNPHKANVLLPAALLSVMSCWCLSAVSSSKDLNDLQSQLMKKLGKLVRLILHFHV